MDHLEKETKIIKCQFPCEGHTYSIEGSTMMHVLTIPQAAFHSKWVEIVAHTSLVLHGKPNNPISFHTNVCLFIYSFINLLI